LAREVGDFKRQLLNFVNALIAISPSRNYVTQFLYLIKTNKNNVDYGIVEEAYPDIVKDDYMREAFAKIFGISFTEKISLNTNGYGHHLTDFISEAFKLFEDSEFRAKVSTILKNEFPEGIPNLAREWLEVRLEGLKSEPNYGQNSIKILKEIVKIGRLKSEELEKRLNLSRGYLFQCLNLLKIYGLVEEDYDRSYKPSEPVRKYQEVLERL